MGDGEGLPRIGSIVAHSETIPAPCGSSSESGGHSAVKSATWKAGCVKLGRPQLLGWRRVGRGQWVTFLEGLPGLANSGSALERVEHVPKLPGWGLRGESGVTLPRVACLACCDLRIIIGQHKATAHGGQRGGGLNNDIDAKSSWFYRFSLAVPSQVHDGRRAECCRGHQKRAIGRSRLRAR